MKLSIIPVMVMAGLSSVGSAQTERDLESHLHGAATLNVAIDSDALYLEFDTPWDNLVGFEHKPSTDEQRKLVNDSIDLLNQPALLFTLSGGNCSINDVAIESGMSTHDDEDDHDDHADKDDHDEHDEHDDKDDHDEHADKDDHDEHADKDDHDDHDEHDEEHDDTHSTALISYSYTCNDIANLTSISVNVFTLWSGFDDLDVQLIGPGGQSLTELSVNQTTIDLKSIQ